jgi:hypothetical protein
VILESGLIRPKINALGSQLQRCFRTNAQPEMMASISLPRTQPAAGLASRLGMPSHVYTSTMK